MNIKKKVFNRIYKQLGHYGYLSAILMSRGIACISLWINLTVKNTKEMKIISLAWHIYFITHLLDCPLYINPKGNNTDSTLRNHILYLSNM